MAIPTNFQGYTPSAGATKSFKIFGGATVGVWGNDVDGTLSTGISIINLAPNAAFLTMGALTDAQIIALLKGYLRQMGAYHEEGAGGYPVAASQQIGITATTCT